MSKGNRWIVVIDNHSSPGWYVSPVFQRKQDALRHMKEYARLRGSCMTFCKRYKSHVDGRLNLYWGAQFTNVSLDPDVLFYAFVRPVSRHIQRQELTLTKINNSMYRREEAKPYLN